MRSKSGTESGKQKVTMQMIADKCGVSKGLVSLALSDRYGVSEETRSQIVMRAIQMGYDFDKVKKHKVYQNKKIIYVLTKDIDLQTDRFWPQIIRGVEEQAKRCEYKIIVKSWNDSTDHKEFISEIVNMKCSGIVIISELPEFIVNNLVLSKIPMVLVDGKIMRDDEIDSTGVNDYAMAYRAVEFAIRNGYRRIAFVGHDLYAHSYRQRYNGFRDCIADYRAEGAVGISLTEVGNDESLTNCYNIEQLTRSLEARECDLYLCASDNIAERLYGYAKRLGVQIPQDIGVIGFDDNYFSQGLQPALTTVSVPKTELGRQTVDLLISRIQNPNGYFKRISVCGELIVRRSLLIKEE